MKLTDSKQKQRNQLEAHGILHSICHKLEISNHFSEMSSRMATRLHFDYLIDQRGINRAIQLGESILEETHS